MYEPREAPLYFAGREAELARLHQRLQRYVVDGPATAKAGLELVIGVPGAGKSALLHQFATLVEPDVDVLTMGVGPLTDDPRSFFLRLAEAARLPKQGRRIAEAEPRTTSYHVKLPAAGVGRQVEQERMAHDIETMLAQLSAQWTSERPLVVLVDELQQADERAKPAMQALHNGLHECPIMVVGAGLQHVPKVLASIGVSRTKRPMELHTLSEDDARIAFVENAARGAGVTNIPAAVLDTLVEKSHCFPVHIQGYLEGLAHEVASAGSATLLNGKSVHRILEYGDRCREAYYDARLDAMNIGSRSARRAMLPLTAALADGGALDRDDAADLCGDETLDGHLVVQEAINHGVLRLHNDMVGYGIPSFHRHMVGLMRQRDGSACKLE